MTLPAFDCARLYARNDGSESWVYPHLSAGRGGRHLAQLRHLGNIQGIFIEHSGHIQGTFKAHSVLS
jgi:hypothetical protein